MHFLWMCIVEVAFDLFSLYTPPFYFCFGVFWVFCVFCFVDVFGESVVLRSVGVSDEEYEDEDEDEGRK